MDYFVRHDEGSPLRGPYSESQILEMVGDGEVPDTATYWHEGMDGWEPVKELAPDASGEDTDSPSPEDEPSDSPPPPPPVSSRRGVLILGLVVGAVVLGLLIWLGMGFFGKVDPLYPIKQGDLWGYVNTEGEMIINPKFDSAQILFEDLGAVKNGDKWGYVNRNGDLIIPAQFKEASYFTEGLAPVQLETKWGYIDEQGKMVIKPQFDHAHQFSQGLAPVVIKEQYGFIDKQGAISINLRFDNVETPGILGRILPVGSLLPVKQDGKWGYIDEDGDWVIVAQFEFARPFINDMAAVQQAGKFGYIGTDGKYRINPDFEDAGDFSSDLAPVKTEGKWGFIDVSGNIQINPRFDDARGFFQGLACVMQVTDGTQDRKWGYIDENGKFVSDPQFKMASSFLFGPLAPVSMGDDGRRAYINKKGKIVWMEQESKSSGEDDGGLDAPEN
jgi:hypothetical protein